MVNDRIWYRPVVDGIDTEAEHCGSGVGTTTSGTGPVGVKPAIQHSVSDTAKT